MEIESGSRVLLDIDTRMKHGIIRRRKEFVNLLLSSLLGDDEAIKQLTRFGVTVISATNDSNSMSVIVDGENVFKR